MVAFKHLFVFAASFYQKARSNDSKQAKEAAVLNDAALLETISVLCQSALQLCGPSSKRALKYWAGNNVWAMAVCRMWPLGGMGHENNHFTITHVTALHMKPALSKVVFAPFPHHPQCWHICALSLLSEFPFPTTTVVLCNQR